jgi:hypothetical protein
VVTFVKEYVGAQVLLLRLQIFNIFLVRYDLLAILDFNFQKMWSFDSISVPTSDWFKETSPPYCHLLEDVQDVGFFLNLLLNL